MGRKKEDSTGGTRRIPVLPLRDAVYFPGLINTLHVVREASLCAVRTSLEGDKRVLTLSQRDMGELDPRTHDLYGTGTVNEILQAVPFADGSMRLVLKGLYRAQAGGISRTKQGFTAEHSALKDLSGGEIPWALVNEAKDAFSRVVQQSQNIPDEALQSISHLNDVSLLADTLAHHLALSPEHKQTLLEELDPCKRLEQAFLHVRREELVLEQRAQIRASADTKIAEAQRSFVLREQLRSIQHELYGVSEAPGDKFRHLLADLPDSAQKYATELILRYERLGDDSAESQVAEKHLDIFFSLPWAGRSEDRLDISAATKLLDDAHFGLEDVKTRILEYLAVRQLTKGHKSPILCFEGPPGVGKTSLARSIAQVLGRSFVPVSLGGIRDEAEIRGHRRTYVGAQPGRIIQGLVNCGTANPVILLDEIDKLVGDSYQSSPAAALLEVLDPGQNHTFRDHFIDFPFDLSDVLFIATANSIASLPAALVDRLEVIPFSSYSENERFEIAKRYVLPTARQEHGLSHAQLKVSDDGLLLLTTAYAREAGVRNIERLINTLCRKCALQVASGLPGINVNARNLGQWLGEVPETLAAVNQSPSPGSCSALVVASYGGDAMQLEAVLLQPLGESPEIRLTGNMGTVMKESAETAVSFLRSGRRVWCNEGAFAQDIHFHATKADRLKEGPSAGLAMVLTLASALMNRPLPGSLAVTGEISLRGEVLAVGGVREKIFAAHRLGFKRVMLPASNTRDVDALPNEVRESLEFLFVSSADQAIEYAFEIPAQALVTAL